MSKRAEITVSGTVQGVGFRWFTTRQAQSYGVTGWVRNNEDGSVSVVAEGDEGSLKSFIEDLRRGPSSANVRDVNINWQEADGQFTRFNVKH